MGDRGEKTGSRLSMGIEDSALETSAFRRLFQNANAGLDLCGEAVVQAVAAELLHRPVEYGDEVAGNGVAPVPAS